MANVPNLDPSREAQLANQNAARALGKDPVNQGMESVAKRINEMDSSVHDVLKKVVEALSGLELAFDRSGDKQVQSLQKSVTDAFAQFTQAKESVGGMTAQDVKNLSDAVAEAAIAAEKAKAMSPEMRDAEIEPFRKAAMEFAKVLTEEVKTVDEKEKDWTQAESPTDTIVKSLSSVKSAVVDNVDAVTSGLKSAKKEQEKKEKRDTLMTKALNAIKNELTGGIGWVEGISLLVGAGIAMKDKIEEAWEWWKKDGLSIVWDYIKDGAQIVWDSIKAFGSDIMSWLKGEAFKKFALSVGDAVKDIGVWIWQSAPDWLSSAFKVIKDLPDTIKSIVDSIAIAIRNAIWGDPEEQGAPGTTGAQKQAAMVSIGSAAVGKSLGAELAIQAKESGASPMMARAFSEYVQSSPLAAQLAATEFQKSRSEGLDVNDAFKKAHAKFKEVAYASEDVVGPSAQHTEQITQRSLSAAASTGEGVGKRSLAAAEKLVQLKESEISDNRKRQSEGVSESVDSGSMDDEGARSYPTGARPAMGTGT